MNKEQILGLIRHILTIAGGALVTRGITDDATSTELVGAVVTIIGIIWSIASKKTTA